MSRIAAAVLIVVAMLAFNSGLLRPAFAESLAATLPCPTVEVKQPTVVRSGRILTLLLTLEALRVTQSGTVTGKG
jgi:hypothetical protein